MTYLPTASVWKPGARKRHRRSNTLGLANRFLRFFYGVLTNLQLKNRSIYVILLLYAQERNSCIHLINANLRPAYLSLPQ